MEKFLLVFILLLTAANFIILTVFCKNQSDKNNVTNKLEDIDKQQKEVFKKISSQIESQKQDCSNQMHQQRQELSNALQTNFSTMTKIIVENQRTGSQMQNERLMNIEERIKTFTLDNEQKLSLIRETVEKRLDKIQNDNNEKLDDMRTIVTEKLNKAINDRMAESFKLVNDRLEQVYKGLGEMQNLAVGVGDLKKVLSNVKTRGILGEVQLGAILKEILAPEQYCENVALKPNSRNVVEFAVKLPSQNGGHIYLPIDSKFPGDTYSALRDAYNLGDSKQIEEARKILLKTIRSEGKDIHDKYISPPYTTDFAIMFLPFEGLYSEVVNSGMIEILQRDYRVNIAGPSTMAALLNSLQMGFKTLAVQKRSSEVWILLEEIAGEFDNFSEVLSATQQKLRQADNELDKLVGVRTRQMQKKLSKVSQYSDELN